ncbi:MAG: sensor histidine kinase [Sphingobacteriales bacterium]|nr:MAG: sensor histidine kinase [Sphingobacteriales bacterium]
MQFFMAIASTLRWHRMFWLTVFLLDLSLPGSAQYSASFDSVYRAAENQPDAPTRLLRLKPLVNQAYEGTPFQTLSFGTALLQAATEAASDTDRYQAHIVLSTGYERNHNFSQAVRHGLQAIELAKQHQDYIRQIRALQILAFTYSSMGLSGNDPADQQNALLQCEQALQLVNQHHVEAERSYTLATTADVHAMFKQYDTAIVLYHQAITAHQAQQQPIPAGWYMNLGNTLDLNKDFTGSLAAYQTADSLNRVQQDNSDFYRLKIASNRAILYQHMGRILESERLALDVLTEARQIGATDIQADLFDHLKKLYQEEGRFPEALRFSDSLAALKERTLNATKTNQIAEMQARYDAGVKDQQIQTQQQTIRSSKRQRLGLWAGVILLVGVGSAAIAGLRRSQQLNRKINAQQQLLLAQKNDLQRMNETKDRLFSLIGHDMRMPLNSLMAYATLLDQQDDLPPEKARKYNANLRQSLGATTVLLENLLHFAKTQMQAMPYRPKRMYLDTVVERTLTLLRPAMDQKALQFRTVYGVETAAFADEDMVEVILRNLLSNAIKFSHTGGTVALTIALRDATAISCTIQDQGTGMSPELTALWNAPSVPTPVRSRPGTQQEKGAGLGLMLIKTFTTVLGSQLAVTSKEGTGSVFSLTLPRDPFAR